MEYIARVCERPIGERWYCYDDTAADEEADGEVECRERKHICAGRRLGTTGSNFGAGCGEYRDGIERRG
jgi:hypothetical protein